MIVFIILDFCAIFLRYLIIDKNEIKIDEKWKKNHEYTFNKNKLKIPISKYNYEYILNGVEESEIRKKVLELLNRPYKSLNLNSDVINILKKRYDLANKLGYKNWGHYSISQFTMEKNNYENIEKFLNIIKEKIEKDYDKIIYDILKISNFSKFNNKNNKKNYWENNAHKLAIYDWHYYYNKIMNKSDEYLINTYFPQNIVLKNFMEIISRIYNFFYEEIQNVEIKKKWPKDSIIYKIERYQSNVKRGSTLNNYENKNMSNNVFLGYIYIIPYMDINFNDYFKIPSMNSLPNTCLISPGHVLIDYKFIRTVPIKNKLFSSSEILTLFHEFGHAYHLLLLSNNLSLSNLFNIPLDYAEFFSHINEHLANNYDIIRILSNKIDNNLKISENLFKTIKFDCSRLSNIYSHSIIDYVVHGINPHLFFSSTINNSENGKDKEEDNLCNFYEMIEKYFPYKFCSFYSIHSTSFPYHFSSYYSGAVLSYLFAEARVLLNNSTNKINLKKNNTLVSFQKQFYDIMLNNFRTENYPSIINNLINSKKSGNFFK